MSLYGTSPRHVQPSQPGTARLTSVWTGRTLNLHALGCETDACASSVRAHLDWSASFDAPQVLADEMTGRLRSSESFKLALLQRDQAEVTRDLDAMQALVS
jgi:hypothetical protein